MLRAFWETSTLQIRDATITTDKDVIAITDDSIVHVFEALSTQTVQYQVPTFIDITSLQQLETITMVTPVAIDAVEDVVAIIDKADQLVLVQTEELIQNNIVVENVVPVQTEITTDAPVADVEIIAVDTEITKVIVIEDEWVEKITVDMITETETETVLESELIQMTVVEDNETVFEIASVIGYHLRLRECSLSFYLLITQSQNSIILAIELSPATNEITSIVKIVRDVDCINLFM